MENPEIVIFSCHIPMLMKIKVITLTCSLFSFFKVAECIFKNNLPF